MLKTALLRILAPLTLLLGLACVAQAHPHMFFNSSAQFILDGKGRLAKLRVAFVIDELNTMYTFAELGVNKDGDQKLTSEETDKIARTVLAGFSHFDYFTYFRDQNGGAIALDKPKSVAVELHQHRLGLVFLLPLAKPMSLSGKSLSLQLYDPTYFTAITIDLPPRILGDGPKCSISVSQPSEMEQTRSRKMLLSQLSREETPGIQNVGAIFAETTRLTCQD